MYSSEQTLGHTACRAPGDLGNGNCKGDEGISGGTDLSSILIAVVVTQL